MVACQRITSAMCYICKKSGYHVLNHLGDFVGVAPQAQAWRAYHFLGGLLSQLGLRELTTKAAASFTVITCLGLQFEIVKMTMSMAPSRLVETISLTEN